MTEISINIIVAIPPEAKPINQHLKLVRDNRYDSFPLYRNNNIALVISGYGKQKSAAATTWLHQINNSNSDGIWINVGIAGHPTHRIGDAFLADAILDQANGDSWSLPTATTLPCPTEKVFSVDEIDNSYINDGLVEMEAAGFYRSALECATPDRIHCLKVVSDNHDNPTSDLNGKIVSNLIHNHLNILDTLIKTESTQ